MFIIICMKKKNKLTFLKDTVRISADCVEG